MSEETTPAAAPNKYEVLFAVYGGATSGANGYQIFSADVSRELQQYLSQGQVQLCISNGVPSPNPNVGPYPPFPDTAPGAHKGFGAVVLVNGVERYFACSEGQTIDFSVQPRDVIHARVLQVSNLAIRYAPNKQYLFPSCGYTLTNNTYAPFPGQSNPSPWVSIDFHLVPVGSQPTAANKIGDMPCQVVPNPLQPQQKMGVSVDPKNLFNISRMLEQNPQNGPAVGTTCAVFVTMRQDGPINPKLGAFSAPFVYNGVSPKAEVGV